MSLLFSGIFTSPGACMWASCPPWGKLWRPPPPHTHTRSCCLGYTACWLPVSAGLTWQDFTWGEGEGSGQAWFVPSTVAHGQFREFSRVNWVTPPGHLYVGFGNSAFVTSLYLQTLLVSSPRAERDTDTPTVSLCWANSSLIDWLMFLF